MTWICVIDPDPQASDLLVDALRNAGYGARGFREGGEALDAIESALEGPRLVILEVLLPGLSGKAVLRRIREGQRARDVPVLVVTGADVDEAYFAPWVVSGVLRKPLAMDALLRKIAEVLPRRRRPATRRKKQD